MKAPLFTIISVLKNNESTFIKMKESLNRQSFQNYEHLIILSNNITDNTIKLVEEYNCNKTKIIFERIGTINKFDAINQGIEKINGRYLIILHGDDFFSNDDCLENLCLFCEQNSKKGIYYSDIKFINKDSKITRVWKCKKESEIKLANVWSIPHTGITYDTRKIRKNDLQYNIEQFISGDLDYILKLYKKYFHLFKYTGFEIITMLNTGDSSKFNNIYKQLSQDIGILKKYHPYSYIFIAIYKRIYKVKQFFLN